MKSCFNCIHSQTWTENGQEFSDCFYPIDNQSKAEQDKMADLFEKYTDAEWEKAATECNHYTGDDHEQMLNLLCDELEVNPNSEHIQEQLSRRIYKGTDCGAWIKVEGIVTTIGSIVEGVDFGTETHELTWPFTKDDFWTAVHKVEEEARYIWEQTHGCDDCNCEGEWGHPAINPNCTTCGGDGDII